MVMDKWAEKIRETVVGVDIHIRNPQMWYEDSQIIVTLKDSEMIYGDIEKRTTFYINKDKMVEYLMSKNDHWNKKIFKHHGTFYHT